MSRKLLSLGYIYEMIGKHEEALAFFEQVLEKDSKTLSTEIIKEAHLGIKANEMALKFKKDKSLVTKNLDMKLMQEKIAIFKENPKNLTGWFSQWN